MNPIPEHADDAPELDDAFFTRAMRLDGLPDALQTKLRGRPKSEYPKQPVKLRIDADVLAAYKATGKGWQTRINEILRRHAPRS